MLVTAFGRELKRLRAEHGLTVRTLAIRLDKSAGYIGQIESVGETPSPEFICKIATVLGEAPDRLLELAKSCVKAQAARDIDSKYARFIAVERSDRQNLKKTGGKRMTTVVSLINMKGGVGKTTLAMQLAYAAARAKFKVLVIDLDPQSNLSQAMMQPKMYVAHLQAKKPTVTQIFDEYVPTDSSSGSPQRVEVDKIILKKVGFELDLIPSRLELSQTLKNPYGKERRLAKALAQLEEQYDLVLIDCAPTESVLTEAAYFASRYIIVPIKPEFMATVGLPLLARSLRGFQHENDDHEISIAGLVINHSSTYTSGPEGQRSIKDVSDIAAENDWVVCENQIKYSASYAKSAREGTPIRRTSYARWASIYGLQKLTEEIFGIIGLTKVTT